MRCPENQWLTFAIFLLLKGQCFLLHSPEAQDLALGFTKGIHVAVSVLGPFFGTLNCPVHAVQYALSSFAFGRGKRGDLKKQRANTTTYT